MRLEGRDFQLGSCGYLHMLNKYLPKQRTLQCKNEECTATLDVSHRLRMQAGDGVLMDDFNSVAGVACYVLM